MLVNSLTIIFSELALVTFILASLMFAVYTKKDQLTSKLIWATALIMITLGALILLLGSGTSKAFGGAFVDDGFARYAKVVILWSSAITLIISSIAIMVTTSNQYIVIPTLIKAPIIRTIDSIISSTHKI